MSSAPLRSPTLRPHRMKKDESFLGKLGGTLARKKKAKEGECAGRRPAAAQASLSPAGATRPRAQASPRPVGVAPRPAPAAPAGPARPRPLRAPRARVPELWRDHASPAGPRRGGSQARALRALPAPDRPRGPARRAAVTFGSALDLRSSCCRDL